MVRGTVEETLNALLDAEADELCKAQRYERSPDRVDTRAGHCTPKRHTKAGEVKLKMPKLRKQAFIFMCTRRYHPHCLCRLKTFSVDRSAPWAMYSSNMVVWP